MRRTALLCCLLVGMLAWSGCSLFRASELAGVEIEKKVSAPDEPEETPRHEELRSEAVDLAARVLGKVESEGAPPRAPIVIVARRGAQIASADVGPPEEPLPMPPAESWEADPEVRKRLEAYAAALGRFKATVRDFWREYRDFKGKSQKTSIRLTSGMLAWKLGLGAMGAALLVVGRAALRYKNVLWRTYLGVQQFRRQEPASENVLLECLRAQRDTQTKSLIRKLHDKTGV